MKRTQEQKIDAGVRAEQTIRDVGPRLSQLESRYLAEMLNAARNGEDTQQHVFKLLALSDFGNDLQQDVDTGRREMRKRDDEALQKAQQEQRWKQTTA